MSVECAGMTLLLLIAGSGLQVLGTMYYFRETLAGRIRPNRVTWLLWSLVPFIAVAAELKAGVGWPVLPVFLNGFIPLLVFGASFWNKRAYWKLGGFDYLCGLCSILAVALWLASGNAAIAVSFSIMADFLAAVPTLVKSWKEPSSESSLAYAGTVAGGVTGIIGAQSFTFTEIGFLVYVTCLNIVMVRLILRKGVVNKR